MIDNALFSTSRFYCRRWLPSDVDSIYAVYSDEEGARWVDDGTPIVFSECERWMDITLANYAKRGYGMFALVERASGKTIGFCGLVHPGGQVLAEIKYAFLRECWGQGYASEVVPAMLSYGLTEHKLTRVIATVDSENLASQRVLLKSGMTLARIETEDNDKTHVYEWSSVDTKL